jgi:hypothetical protein
VFTSWIIGGAFSYVTRQFRTVNTNRGQWCQLGEVSIWWCLIKNKQLLGQPEPCTLGKKPA